MTIAEAIVSATRRTLEVADELGAESLALPAFGTGVGGFPLDECAGLMVAAVRAYEPRTLRVWCSRSTEPRPRPRSRNAL